MNTYLKSKNGSKCDLPTTVEMMDVCDERKRRSYPAVGAHSSTVHPTEQRVQRDGACSQGVSADLTETFPKAFQSKSGLLMRVIEIDPSRNKLMLPVNERKPWSFD